METILISSEDTIKILIFIQLQFIKNFLLIDNYC